MKVIQPKSLLKIKLWWTNTHWRAFKRNFKTRNLDWCGRLLYLLKNEGSQETVHFIGFNLYAWMTLGVLDCKIDLVFITEILLLLMSHFKCNKQELFRTTLTHITIKPYLVGILKCRKIEKSLPPANKAFSSKVINLLIFVHFRTTFSWKQSWACVKPP